jgi:hypothetical protein
MTHRYLNPSLHTEQITAAMIREYSDFTLYLYQREQHAHKKFVISDWEADNDVYCGNAFAYANIQAFRLSCNSSYSTTYSGNASPEESLVGAETLVPSAAARHRRWAQSRSVAKSRRKRWQTAGPRVWMGKEQERLTLIRDQGKWQIVEEKRTKLYWMRKEHYDPVSRRTAPAAR